MIRTENDLQVDLLKKEINKKDREVHRLKVELESAQELSEEKDRVYEIKRLKHNQQIERL